MESINHEYPNRAFNLSYFDSAGRSVLPASVEEVGVAALKQKAQPWNGVGSESDVTDSRELFGSLIGCGDASRIALTPSTGFAMTMAAANVVASGKLGSGKVVLMLDKEMGSVVYPWQGACKSTGAILRVVADPFLEGSSQSWTEAVLAALDETVAVVALPAVHWCSGATIDLATVAERIAGFPPEERPYFIVDGTQSLGVVSFDAVALDVDFVACSVHKWLNAPYGMSLVYVAPRHHASWLPLDHHERGRVGSNGEGWDEVIFMHPETGFYPEALYPDARRFDGGGKANPIVVPMVRAALQWVLRLGVDNIEKTTRGLTNALAEQLHAVFGSHALVHPEAQRSAHIFGVRFHPASPFHAAVPLVALNAALKANGVYCSVRGEWLRVSVYVYTRPSDVRRFVSVFTLCAQDMLVQQQLALGGAEAKTVLITGGAGWLAQFLTQSLLPQCVPRSHAATVEAVPFKPVLKLHVSYNGAVPHWFPAERRHQLDMSDGAAVGGLIASLKPDLIIHTAALSSPVVCHRDEQRAYAVNCPGALIAAVQEHVPNALFLFTSTDMVYGGERAPYKTDGSGDNDAEGVAADGADAPVNVYGASKLAFERLVRRLRYGTVLRLSNMIGAPYVYHPAGCKFLEWVHGAYTRREFVGLKGREIRSFVYVQDVVSLVLELARRHLAGDTSVWEHQQAPAAGEGGEPRSIGVPAGEWSGTGTGTGTGLVLNVGGPRAQSRLQVAQRLCAALGGQLVIAPAGEEAGPQGAATGADTGDRDANSEDSEAGRQWRVFVLDDAPVASPVTGAGAGTAAAGATGAGATGAGATGAGATGTSAGAVEPTPTLTLRSPRDISMDSSPAEALLGRPFRETDSVLLGCLAP